MKLSCIGAMEDCRSDTLDNSLIQRLKCDPLTERSPSLQLAAGRIKKQGQENWNNTARCPQFELIYPGPPAYSPPRVSRSSGCDLTGGSAAAGACPCACVCGSIQMLVTCNKEQRGGGPVLTGSRRCGGGMAAGL